MIGRQRPSSLVTPGLVILLAALACAGCSDKRTVRIDRDRVINTGFDPGGYPIQVDVVSVFPSDLKQEVNRDLRPDRPDGPITADVWFRNKPTKDSMKDKDDNKHYRLSAEQIHSYTDEDEGTFWGIKKGGKLTGSDSLGGSIVIGAESGVPVKDVFSDRAVVYVFARFTDAQGNVLKTRPAVFWKVGDFDKTLTVQIKAQTIERTTRRESGRPLPWEEGAVAQSER